MSRIKVNPADVSPTSAAVRMSGVVDAFGGLIDVTGTPTRVKKPVKRSQKRKRSRMKFETALGGLGLDRALLDADTAKAVRHTVKSLNLPLM